MKQYFNLLKYWTEREKERERLIYNQSVVYYIISQCFGCLKNLIKWPKYKQEGLYDKINSFKRFDCEPLFFADSRLCFTCWLLTPCTTQKLGTVRE